MRRNAKRWPRRPLFGWEAHFADVDYDGQDELVVYYYD